MVWGLLPLEPLPGAETFYIFAKGAYKVGRKDCDVVIQTDRAISRLHAEIVVGTMFLDVSTGMSSGLNVCIRDHSKFGTFVNKAQSSKPVHSYPNKEKTLKDGDTVTFGTGNASFRFCFINLTVFIGCSMNFPSDYSLQSIMSSIGAHTTNKWSKECTHILADESSDVTCHLLDAIIEQKPVVLGTWFKVLSEKNIRTEIPDCNIYSPTLMLNGAYVKLVDPKSREKCLKGYKFVVGPLHLYEFGDKLLALLPAVGAEVIQIDEFSKSVQNSACGDENQFAYVNPSKSGAKISQFNSLSRVSELELIIAAFSGRLEPMKIEAPSILVSSSHSTDETIVADSQVEVDTATSDDKVVKPEVSVNHETVGVVCHVKKDRHDNNTDKSKQFAVLSSGSHAGGFTQRNCNVVDNAGLPESQSSDIIYSHDLIVKNASVPTPVIPISEVRVVNFKRFTKNAVDSGNSFVNFIPFAKDPYRESDSQGKDVSAYVKEERKRKQMEAVAEDLFSSVKAKKRGSSGQSLLAFFSRS